MTDTKLLLIGHYPLDVLDRAPKVRIHSMAEALGHYAQVHVVSDTRTRRRRALSTCTHLINDGTIDAVYVESASSTATPWDIHFFQLVKRKGIPLGIFVRDAYQLFPHLYPQTGIKRRLLSAMYRLTLSQYKHLATTLYVPSAGLRTAIGAPNAVLLPPGSLWRGERHCERAPTSTVIYVGAAGPHDGVDYLIAAMSKVRQRVVGAELILVLRSGESKEVAVTLSDGIQIIEASGDELSTIYARAQVAVIARRNTEYNRLAIPVKFFEYLSYGVPVVVTRPSEIADIVEKNHLGWTCDDSIEGLSNALTDALLHTGDLTVKVREFVEDNSWDERAKTVLKTLIRG